MNRILFDPNNENQNNNRKNQNQYNNSQNQNNQESNNQFYRGNPYQYNVRSNMQNNINRNNINNQQNIEKVNSENKKTKVRKGYEYKSQTKKIVKVYAIILILIEIIIIGKSSFSIAENMKKVATAPEVNVVKMGKEIQINIKSETPMKEISYDWNSEGNTIINTESRTEKTFKVEIPNGNNILNIIVTDENGDKTYFKKQYIYESADGNKPDINIEVNGKNLKITATDDTKIAYLVYKWNAGEETKVDKGDDDKTINAETVVQPGENVLTVIAVDAEGNQQEKSEKIIGDLKPVVTISIENNQLVINAKDDEGINKITVTVDGNTTDSGDTPINQKEVNATLDIEKGNHNIQVIVTNINGLETKKELSASN